MGGRGQGGGRTAPPGLLWGATIPTPLPPPPDVLSHPPNLETSPPQELEDPQMKSRGRARSASTISKLGGLPTFQREARCLGEGPVHFGILGNALLQLLRESSSHGQDSASSPIGWPSAGQGSARAPLVGHSAPLLGWMMDRSLTQSDFLIG